MKKLIIFGTGSIAEVAYDYFQNESDYEVCLFTVEEDHIENSMFLPRVIFPFNGIEDVFPPSTYDMFIAIGSLRLNHTRERIFCEAKEKGYKLATFISQHAYIGRNVKIGENCFIQEHNNIQYGVSIGDNTIIWASNHIGHHTEIGSHCFLASGIALSGYCNIGDYSFIGCGVSTKDGTKVGKRCLIGLNATITKDIKDERVCTAPQSETKTFDTLSDSAKKLYYWG